MSLELPYAPPHAEYAAASADTTMSEAERLIATIASEEEMSDDDDELLESEMAESFVPEMYNLMPESEPDEDWERDDADSPDPAGPHDRNTPRCKSLSPNISPPPLEERTVDTQLAPECLLVYDVQMPRFQGSGRRFRWLETHSIDTVVPRFSRIRSDTRAQGSPYVKGQVLVATPVCSPDTLAIYEHTLLHALPAHDQQARVERYEAMLKAAGVVYHIDY